MVQPDAVLEVAYRILDLGVTAMIGLQFQRLPIAVGDEGVIAVPLRLFYTTFIPFWLGNSDRYSLLGRTETLQRMRDS